VVVVPVFEDMEEMQTSPYKDEDWYEERTSWKWMNTIMRVNSLVQKVRLILCTRSC
jgi:tRNA-splicing endonuclease subunit Sen2